MKQKYKIEAFLFKNYMEKGEKIGYAIHIHPLLYHVQLAKLKMLYLVLPIILLLIFPFAFWISIGLFLVGVVKLLLLVFNWFFNCWLVTNKGVIAIEANDIWHRHSSRTEHEMIAGVSFEKKGMLGSLLNFGTITLEREGNSSKIVRLEKIKNPLKAELKIIEHQKTYMAKKANDDQKRFRDVFNEMTLNYLSSAK